MVDEGVYEDELEDLIEKPIPKIKVNIVVYSVELNPINILVHRPSKRCVVIQLTKGWMNLRKLLFCCKVVTKFK